MLAPPADDLGWSNVGYHNDHAVTPHLDGLVKAGIELDRHYAYYYCAPTRASFLTGRYPAHVNEQFDDCSMQGTAPLKMTLIAAKLKLAGYSTHQIGMCVCVRARARARWRWTCVCGRAWAVRLRQPAR